MPQVGTQEVFRQVPVPVMQQIEMPLPQPFVQTGRKFVEAPQVQMMEPQVPVRQNMTQEVAVSVAKSDVQVLTQGVLVPVAVPKTLDSPRVQLVDKVVHSRDGTETGPLQERKKIVETPKKQCRDTTPGADDPDRAENCRGAAYPVR